MFVSTTVDSSPGRGTRVTPHQCSLWVGVAKASGCGIWEEFYAHLLSVEQVGNAGGTSVRNASSVYTRKRAKVKNFFLKDRPNVSV